MKALDCQFTKIINGTTQFVIPVFQRDYSWTEAQCEQLWNDVLHIAADTSERGHFIGSVVYIPTGDSAAGFTRWLLIDGQQRVTTLTLLLTALRDHISETKWTGSTDGPTAKRIDAYFLKNLQEEGSRHHKLVLRRHDQSTLRALLDGVDPPELASERIMENYDFFREKLTDVDPEAVYLGIGRLIVVDVTLVRGIDDPQSIFESLNSTGMDLSQSDLIRNFILMRLQEKEQTRMYETYWSKIEALFRGSESTFDAFIRDYVALETRASKQEKANEIYQAFRRIESSLITQNGGLESTLGEMLRYSGYYASFSIGSPGYPELSDAFLRLRKLADVPAILIMQLFRFHVETKTLTLDEFHDALRIIESYLFRRAICGEQTRGYWQLFANLAYALNEKKPLESLKVALACQHDSYQFPSNLDFERELNNRDIYGLRVCRYLLERLENDGTKELSDTSEYSVEHVMPQNEKVSSAWQKMLGENWKIVQKEWLHRLGNLTLTGYNSKYSDRPFDEKKRIPGGFEESSVRLNKYIREQKKWTMEEIKRRGELLSKRALKIWPELVVEPSAIELARQAELRELAARRDVNKVHMSSFARELFSHLSSRIRELDEKILELAETKSVSYHASSFFLEVLPRKRKLSLLLPLEFGEIDDPSEIARDATEWKFFFYAKYEGGVFIQIKDLDDIQRAMPLIRQAYLTVIG